MLSAHKASKSEANYTPHGTEAEHCGNCRHFRAPRDCTKVEGIVVAAGWCWFFQREAA